VGIGIPSCKVDALVVKVREGGQVRSVSALIAVGINEQGYREILGLQVGDSESEASWTALFIWLKRRGLQDVDLVVSDDHGGLVKAVQEQFQGASWQRCQTHLTRNVCDAAPKPLHEEILGRLRPIFTAPDLPTARTLLERFINDFTTRAPNAVQVLEHGFDDATAVLSLPAAYRQRLRTNNGVERLNEEIRRRERVIRIFPNRDSAIRLMGALLLELDEQWSTGHRYFDMTLYWCWRGAQETRDLCHR
jgi:transposase-like protein